MIGFIKRTLDELIALSEVNVLAGLPVPEIPITGIVFDSRAVQPGSLFVPLVGQTADGHDFIKAAINNGAAAVAGSRPIESLPVPYFQVENTRLALARFSAAFYGFPGRHLSMIGVTGTDGKTTTSNLVYQIMLEAGLRPGIISTINALIGDEVVDTGFHVTTPEAPDVQRYLARMVTAGLSHVVLESTSHGLDQHRVSACDFDIGILTNITHEHLDYHGSYEAYRAAKARLFTDLATTHFKSQGNPRLAVLNQDDPSFDFLSQISGIRAIGYSLRPGADLWASELCHDSTGLHFIANGPGFTIPIDCSLVGEFNVSNCLAAIGATVLGLNLDPDVARRGIAALRGVPGRMECIHLGQDFIAMVDFAHTPNALKVALQAARKMTSGRVIAVFGSAGLRDRQKRRIMAEVSVGEADISILTAEDPRTESLDEILTEMADAARSQGGVEGKNFYRVPDRPSAIQMAVEMARPDDLVITCGKGHEQSMCFGTVEIPWDDRIAMRAALASHLGIPGPSMPKLPTSI
jgi:UDP-N-acetylmuramoyl-L-alanyl-D-glutamate--2,6-diaminopimelate ligase